MIVLDAGVDDIREEEDSFEILTSEEDFDAVEKALKDEGIVLASSEVTMIPQNYVKVTDETVMKQIRRILDILDDDDDVQAVYHNWEED
jgi:transcriptional/translational regulatory protein YebC/TACO1